MAAVLLESARKGFWEPAPVTLESLAMDYAMSLERNGASGSVRTTGNRQFEEFVELRVAASARPELVPVLRDELRDGGAPQVEGKRLVEQAAPQGPDLIEAGPAAGLATFGHPLRRVPAGLAKDAIGARPPTGARATRLFGAAR